MKPLLQSRPESYIYQLKPYPWRSLLTGFTSDQRQFFCSREDEGHVFVFFDLSGDLLESRVYPISLIPNTIFRPIFDRSFDYKLHFSLDSEIECTVAPIKVKRFFVKEYGYGINDYPHYWYELVENPELDPEEREQLPSRIEIWLAEKNFAFIQYDEYWINGDGTIVAT